MATLRRAYYKYLPEPALGAKNQNPQPAEAVGDPELQMHNALVSSVVPSQAQISASQRLMRSQLNASRPDMRSLKPTNRSVNGGPGGQSFASAAVPRSSSSSSSSGPTVDESFLKKISSVMQSSSNISRNMLNASINDGNVSRREADELRRQVRDLVGVINTMAEQDRRRNGQFADLFDQMLRGLNGQTMNLSGLASQFRGDSTVNQSRPVDEVEQDPGALVLAAAAAEGVQGDSVAGAEEEEDEEEEDDGPLGLSRWLDSDGKTLSPVKRGSAGPPPKGPHIADGAWDDIVPSDEEEGSNASAGSDMSLVPVASNNETKNSNTGQIRAADLSELQVDRTAPSTTQDSKQRRRQWDKTPDPDLLSQFPADKATPADTSVLDLAKKLPADNERVSLEEWRQILMSSDDMDSESKQDLVYSFGLLKEVVPSNTPLNFKELMDKLDLADKLAKQSRDERNSWQAFKKPPPGGPSGQRRDRKISTPRPAPPTSNAPRVDFQDTGDVKRQLQFSENAAKQKEKEKKKEDPPDEQPLEVKPEILAWMNRKLKFQRVTGLDQFDLGNNKTMLELMAGAPAYYANQPGKTRKQKQQELNDYAKYLVIRYLAHSSEAAEVSGLGGRRGKSLKGRGKSSFLGSLKSTFAGVKRNFTDGKNPARKRARHAGFEEMVSAPVSTAAASRAAPSSSGQGSRKPGSKRYKLVSQQPAI